MEDQTPIVSYKDQYDDLLYPNLIDSSPLCSDNNCAQPFNSSIFEGVPTVIYDDGAASSAVADINDHHHGLHVGTDDTFLDVVDLEVGSSGYHETSGEVGRGDGEMWLVWEIEFALDEFPLRVWSVTQRPESCSQCQVLREIVHVNSAHTARLEIHGSIGLISHGILVNDHSINLEQMGNSREHQFFDFYDRHMEAVKKFLKWYLRKRTDDGYILQQHDNPTVAFLEALCVGLDFHNDTRYHDHALVTGTDVQERGPPRDHLDVGGDQVNQTAFDISEVVMSEAIFDPMMHHQAVIEGDDQAAIPYFDRVTGEGLLVDETVLPSASHLSGSGDRVYRGDEEAVNHGAETLHCDANQHGSVHDHPAGNPPMLNENNVPPAEDDAAAAARTQLSLKCRGKGQRD